MRLGTDGRRTHTGTDAVLSGISLLSLDSRLTLTDAQELPAWETPLSERAGMHGRFPAGLRRRSLEIRLSVHMKAWDVRERGNLYQKLCGWAKPGPLTVSWRENQQLQTDVCYVESLPSVHAWTRTVTVRLTAHLQPFFRDTEPLLLKETAARVSFSLTPPGTAGAAADLKVVNQEADELLQLTAETRKGNERQSFLTLRGLDLLAGEAVEISHDAFGLLQIRARGASVLACRTPESSDDLILVSGEEQVLRVSAMQKVRVEARVYGLYL